MEKSSKPAYSGSSVAVEDVVTPTRRGTAYQQLFSPRRRALLALADIVIVLALATIYHYAVYVPQPDVPHRLTLLDAVFAPGVFGLVGLVGLALGRRALRPFRLTGSSQLERGALAVGLGWGMLSLGVLALGLAQLLYSWLLIAALALVLVVCWRDVWRLLSLLTSAAPYRWLRLLAPHGWFQRMLAAVECLEVVHVADSGEDWIPYLVIKGSTSAGRCASFIRIMFVR